ncbi:hypothetical protein NQ317_003021 [Molorchus minor]|uniref:Papilin n=1 Tax=Molorchus minor TaxID=1323400 RepID=A0ABQ9IWT2_9CUCU|nr:hypothetical protein NQ317_003021 [Molorchus minor]
MATCIAANLIFFIRITEGPVAQLVKASARKQEIAGSNPGSGWRIFHWLRSLLPVRANITVNDQRYPVGSTIELPCHVIGYPEPQVNWYKDGTPIYPSERLLISDAHTLTILQATKDDSGIYQCEATNAYSTASSSLELFIEGQYNITEAFKQIESFYKLAWLRMYIHPNCKDNQLFANCALIVRAKYCSHKYYAKFCCKSCTEAGLLPVDGPHLDDYNKRTVLSTNLIPEAKQIASKLNCLQLHYILKT